MLEPAVWRSLHAAGAAGRHHLTHVLDGVSSSVPGAVSTKCRLYDYRMD